MHFQPYSVDANGVTQEMDDIAVSKGRSENCPPNLSRRIWNSRYQFDPSGVAAAVAGRYHAKITRGVEIDGRCVI